MKRFYTKLLMTALMLSASVSALAQKTYEVNAQSLNVRSGPSAKTRAEGVLHMGERVEVVEISNGWAKINYKGKTAYVSARYINEVPEPQRGKKGRNRESGTKTNAQKQKTTQKAGKKASASKAPRRSTLGYFRKGTVLLDIGVGGGYNHDETPGALFTQKVGADFGVANLGPRTSLGVGFTLNNAWGDADRQVVAGVYDYEYTLTTTIYKRNSTHNWVPAGSETRSSRRKGAGTADARVATENVQLLANLSLHHQFSPKFSGYLVVGAGAGMLNLVASDLEPLEGLEEDSRSDALNRNASGEQQILFKYAYDDMKQADFSATIYKHRFCPAVAGYLGGRFSINRHFSAFGEIGFNTATLHSTLPNSYNLATFGVSYKL